MRLVEFPDRENREYRYEVLGMDSIYEGDGEPATKKIRPKKIRPLTVALIAAVSIGIAGLIVAAAIVLTGTLFLSGESFETRSLEDYGSYEGHIEAEDALFTYSSLLIFPKTLPTDAKVNDFLYVCSSKGLDNSYQLLLDYQLLPGEFKKEVERLQNLSVSYGEKTNRVIYDTELFSYPAYVTVCTEDGDLEFALIDEKNNRIIAVLALKGRGSLDESLFPQSPPVYETGTSWFGYSIYQFEVINGVMGMAE
jgi:hypothetical protein